MKISMKYVYIKPKVKENETRAVTAAMNEACIG